MTQLSVDLRGLDPRDLLELRLDENGSGRCWLTTPKSGTWIDLDVEKMRELLLMLDTMLEDYDKITLGIDRMADAVDTEPL